MSRNMKIAGLVIAGIAVVAAALIGATAAFAQTPDPVPPPFPPNRGAAMAGENVGLMVEYREIMHETIAEALGLSVEELDAALAEGQTMWQIAQAQGVDLAEVQATMQAARAQMIAQALEDGVLTQEQATWMLSRMSGAGAQHGFGGGPLGRPGAGRGACGATGFNPGS